MQSSVRIQSHAGMPVLQRDVMESTSLVLFVCERENGWPRSIVSCAAMIAAAQKVTSMNVHTAKLLLMRSALLKLSYRSKTSCLCLLSLRAELQGLHLMANDSQTASCQPSIQSSQYLLRKFHSPVMAARAAGKLGESVGCLQAAGMSLSMDQTICACRWIGATLSALQEGQHCRLLPPCACNASL